MDLKSQLSALAKEGLVSKVELSTEYWTAGVQSGFFRLAFVRRGTKYSDSPPIVELFSSESCDLAPRDQRWFKIRSEVDRLWRDCKQDLALFIKSMNDKLAAHGWGKLVERPDLAWKRSSSSSDANSDEWSF